MKNPVAGSITFMTSTGWLWLERASFRKYFKCIFAIPLYVTVLLYIPSADAIILSDNGVGGWYGMELGGVGKIATPLRDKPSYVENCTGTAVSARVIVSAAHCFDKGAGRSRITFPVFDANGVYRNETRTYEGRTVIHPGWKGRRSRNVNSGNNDIALMVLDNDLDSNIPKYRFGSYAKIPVGLTVKMVGYGNIGTGTTGQIKGSGVFGIPGVTYNNIDADLGDWLENIPQPWGSFVAARAKNREFIIDFDGGGRNRMGSGAVLTRNRLSKSGNVTRIYEGTTAQGDSGGPVFWNALEHLRLNKIKYPGFSKAVSGENILIGITSFGIDEDNNKSLSNYGDISAYTFVSPFEDWILSYVTNSASLAGPMAARTLEFSTTASDTSYLSSGSVIWEPELASAAVVPVPPAIVLFGSGLVGLLIITGRRSPETCCIPGVYSSPGYG